VSSAGAEPRPTTHYVPVKRLIEAGSLIQAASSIEARDRGGFKDDRTMRPIWVPAPKNFGDSLTMPTATFPNFFHGLLL